MNKIFEPAKNFNQFLMKIFQMEYFALNLSLSIYFLQKSFKISKEDGSRRESATNQQKFLFLEMLKYCKDFFSMNIKLCSSLTNDNVANRR